MLLSIFILNVVFYSTFFRVRQTKGKLIPVKVKEKEKEKENRQNNLTLNY